MKANISPILAELRQQLENRYQDRLERIILYGSQARGDAEPGSDIDVMVVLKGNIINREERKKNSDFLFDLSYEYDIVVSCFFVSSDRFLYEQSPLLMNVRREGIFL